MLRCTADGPFGDHYATSVGAPSMSGAFAPQERSLEQHIETVGNDDEHRQAKQCQERLWIPTVLPESVERALYLDCLACLRDRLAVVHERAPSQHAGARRRAGRAEVLVPEVDVVAGVSIVAPGFNGERFIEQALVSALVQEGSSRSSSSTTGALSDLRRSRVNGGE